MLEARLNEQPSEQVDLDSSFADLLVDLDSSNDSKWLEETMGELKKDHNQAKKDIALNESKEATTN